LEKVPGVNGRPRNGRSDLFIPLDANAVWPDYNLQLAWYEQGECLVLLKRVRALQAREFRVDRGAGAKRDP
jgi:hypothetical protein